MLYASENKSTYYKHCCKCLEVPVCCYFLLCNIEKKYKDEKDSYKYTIWIYFGGGGTQITYTAQFYNKQI